MAKPTKFEFVQMSNQYKALCSEYSKIFEDKQYPRRDFALAEIDRRRSVLRDALKLHNRDLQTGLAWASVRKKTEQPNSSNGIKC